MTRQNKNWAYKGLIIIIIIIIIIINKNAWAKHVRQSQELYKFYQSWQQFYKSTCILRLICLISDTMNFEAVCKETIRYSHKD